MCCCDLLFFFGGVHHKLVVNPNNFLKLKFLRYIICLAFKDRVLSVNLFNVRLALSASSKMASSMLFLTLFVFFALSSFSQVAFEVEESGVRGNVDSALLNDAISADDMHLFNEALKNTPNEIINLENSRGWRAIHFATNNVALEAIKMVRTKTEAQKYCV